MGLASPIPVSPQPIEGWAGALIAAILLIAQLGLPQIKFLLTGLSTQISTYFDSVHIGSV
jgi:hypothetical protein